MRRTVVLSAVLALLLVLPAGAGAVVDDETIVYAKGRKVFVRQSDGSSKTLLTEVDRGELACCVSMAPAADRVIYLTIGRRDSRAGLDVVKTDGTGGRTVAPAKWEVGDYGWDPTGKRIAFTAYTGDRAGVYITRGNGKARKRVWDKAVGGGVSWNHDGTKLAFTSYKKGRGRIFYHDLDTRELYKVPPLTDAFDPEWSPTEDVFLFYSQADPQVFEFDLYRIGADGTGEERISDPSEEVGRALWSPDGSTILYSATVNGRDKIFSVDADGTNKTEVVADEDGPDVDSSLYLQPFSPDGTSFVYEIYNYSKDTFDLLSNAIRTADLSGAYVDQVTDPDASFLNWSPDSSRMLVCIFDVDAHSNESRIYEVADPGSFTAFLPTCDTDWDRRP